MKKRGAKAGWRIREGGLHVRSFYLNVCLVANAASCSSLHCVLFFKSLYHALDCSVNHF